MPETAMVSIQLAVKYFGKANRMNGCNTHSLSENVLFLLKSASCLLLSLAVRLCLDETWGLRSFNFVVATKSETTRCRGISEESAVRGQVPDKPALPIKDGLPEKIRMTRANNQI
jgi:hypothetical protein